MTRYIILAAFLSSVANAQDVPPPPNPAENDLSLEATMQFIQDKLNGQGKVSWVSNRHDSNTNQVIDSMNVSIDLSETNADSRACTLSFLKVEVFFAPVRSENRGRLSFRGVEKLEVSALRQQGNVDATDNGHPKWSFSIAPAVYVLSVSMTPESKTRVHLRTIKGDQVVDERDREYAKEQFYFKEEEMAHRVAKAMLHAVELCGGGNKDPF